MKFLPPEKVTPRMMPLNFIYDRGEDYANDFLTICWKDVDTNMKSTVTILNPKIEIYIVKPEFRQELLDTDRNESCHWMPISKCEKHLVPYQSRYSYAAKVLNLPNSSDARLSPFLYGADIDIENWYLIQFVKEYPYDGVKKLSVGYMDIESDIISLRPGKFPEYGEAPTNAVTFIDGTDRQVYTLLLTKNNVPVVSKEHPLYLEYEEYRKAFDEQIQDFMDHESEFISYMNEKYDEIYGHFDYTVAYFEDELKMTKVLFALMKECNNDFIYVWNLPYDMQMLMGRVEALGGNLSNIIADSRIVKTLPKDRDKLVFVEDKNPKAGKRRHKCITWTSQVFTDQMVVYSGVRGGRGELASTKLGYIAQKELKDTKLDYSEDGDIRTLPYRNYRMFVEYNIKDVLLQYGIEHKTNDMGTIYARMYSLFVLPNQAFTTTKVVLHALYEFALRYKDGYILGQNRNKGKMDSHLTNYQQLLSGIDEDTDEDAYFDAIFGDEQDSDADDTDDEELEDGKEEKREKYAGAFVMNPLYLNPTGLKIRGKDSKWVHEDVCDFDVKSEYPSAVVIDNISCESMVGKVFLEGDLTPYMQDIKGNMEFRGDEAAKYKFDPSNFLVEQFSERDYISFGTDYLGLPSFDEICRMIDEGEV